jgi:ppGpp synthetase/RelA/SpoT-type nucleotidyltranferase
MEINKAKEVIDEFAKNLTNIQSYIDEKIISEEVALDMCADIKYYRSKCFKDFFGEETDTSKNGLFQREKFFTKKEGAVILSVWDQVAENTPEKAFRENTFYKGYRWSSDKRKSDFYFYFNILSNQLGKQFVPLTFFTFEGIKGDKRYIKIVTMQEKYFLNQRETAPSNNDSILYFPKIKPSNSRSHIDILINKIIELKDLKDKDFDQNECCIEEIIEEIKNLTKSALVQFRSLRHNHKYKRIVDEIKKNLNSITNRSYEDEDIFKIILQYQYYDIPYNIHLFLPQSSFDNLTKDSKTDKVIAPYCLVFTTPCVDSDVNPEIIESTNNVINKNKDSFIKLSDELSRINQIQSDIWKSAGDNLKIKNGWKSIYDKNRYKYDLLANAAQNIIRAICESNKITGYAVTSRVKEFESLYKKIIDHINYTTNEPDPFSDITFNNRTERFNYYRDILNHPLENKSILNKINDIAGVRIICKYINDVATLRTTLTKSCANNEFGLNINLTNVGVLSKEDMYNSSGYNFYTSDHYNILLSKERTKLVEFKEIGNIPFELQVRTTLSHSILDVSHELFYKPNLPKVLVAGYQNSIEAEFKQGSAKLFEVDEKFSELKQIHTTVQNKNI